MAKPCVVRIVTHNEDAARMSRESGRKPLALYLIISRRPTRPSVRANGVHG